MNLIDFQRKLLAVARADQPSAHVPLAFEKRVRAQLAFRPVDPWLEWAKALWRAAAPCVGVLVVLGAWTVGAAALAPADLSADADLEAAVIAAVNAPGEGE